MDVTRITPTRQDGRHAVTHSAAWLVVILRYLGQRLCREARGLPAEDRRAVGKLAASLDKSAHDAADLTAWLEGSR
jgi:hypothetical protein